MQGRPDLSENIDNNRERRGSINLGLGPVLGASQTSLREYRSHFSDKRTEAHGRGTTHTGSVASNDTASV